MFKSSSFTFLIFSLFLSVIAPSVSMAQDGCNNDCEIWSVCSSRCDTDSPSYSTCSSDCISVIDDSNLKSSLNHLFSCIDKNSCEFNDQNCINDACVEERNSIISVCDMKADYSTLDDRREICLSFIDEKINLASSGLDSKSTSNNSSCSVGLEHYGGGGYGLYFFLGFCFIFFPRSRYVIMP